MTQTLSRLSFRWQIILLGALAAVLLLAVLIAIFAALQYTKSAVLNGETRNLSETTRRLAREYAGKAEFVHQTGEALPLENPTSESSRQALTLLSRVVLQSADDVEGGYYAMAGDVLIGYSFPTQEGNQKMSERDLPPEESSEILQAARQAALTHQPVEKVVTGPQDFVLIAAIPLSDGSKSVGSAWTLKRLPGLPGSNRFRTYLTAVVLGTAALTCVILTLLVIRNMQSGVRKIEGGLERLEGNLTARISADEDPDEIRRIAHAINRLAATLKENSDREKQIEGQLQHSERLAALGRLVAGVAHEVRNPLATIRLRLQMCQQEVNDPDAQESCAVALAEIERLDGMVNRLLNFAQPLQLHLEPTHIDHLIQQRLQNFRQIAGQQGVRFITSFSEDLLPVSVDQNRMAQVFDNVIQNAIEAMGPSGGTLCVSAGLAPHTNGHPNKVCMEFNDTGRGIGPDAVRRIFEPFFTTKTSGTGLGLSICHELVRAHGGEIRVTSGEGHGTSIRILLPVREDDEPKRTT